MNTVPYCDVTGLIPARWASSRFPGKPLALIAGVPMIERVYRRVAEALGHDHVAVATDDVRIRQAVEAFGGRVVMTSPDCASGTERCVEAFATLGSPTPYLINIQGDEPFVSPSQIRQVAEMLHRPGAEVATLMRPFGREASYDQIADPNVVKVVADLNLRALYFSRLPIPYLRDVPRDQWGSTASHYAHVGMYGFTAKVVRHLSQIARSPLQHDESLEQLAWLQHGIAIQMGITTEPTIGIDTPADLQAAECWAASQGL